MDSYNLADAKARLSELVERAAAGEEIQISKRGEAMARLVPVKKPLKPIDMESIRRIRAMTPPDQVWRGPDSYVEWLRKTDQL